MAVVAKIGKLVSRGWAADLRRALAPLLFLALVTCHTSRLFGQRFTHLPVAMVQVTNALTSSPFALTLASHPAQVLAACTTVGCTNGGPRAITAGAVRAVGFNPSSDSVWFVASASVPSWAACGTAISPSPIAPSLPNELLYGAASPRAGADLTLWGLSPWAFCPRKLMKNGHGWRRRAAVWHVCAPSRGRIHPARVRLDVCATPGFSTLRCPEGTRPSEQFNPEKNRRVSTAETPRYRLALRDTRWWSGNDPSPATLRLMKAPERDPHPKGEG